MARKQKRPPIPTMEHQAPTITKLDNVPGPEENIAILREHYSRVQVVVACHAYDDVILACRWCCDMESPLAYSKPDEARGNKMFCSGRCASAFGVFRADQLLKPQTSDAESTTPPTEETATNEEPPVSKRRGRTTKATPTEEPAEEPDDEPAETETEAATSESPPAWKPKGHRAPKARKQRATKPERSDGKCAKGLHEMTDENRYEYKGTVWCRECRKASRSKSKNGNGKAKK